MVKKKIRLTKLNCFMKAKTTSCVCCFNVLKSSRALCPHFSVCFSILITSLGEEGAGLCASRTFVCLFCACMIFVLFLFLLVSRVGCGL